MMSDPVEDGRVGDIAEPLWIRLIWDPDDEEWTASTNASVPNPERVMASAFAAVLYRLAIGDFHERT